MKKKICLLATGGTIACVATEKGFVPGLSGEELLKEIPRLGELAEFEVRQIMNIDSSDMQVADWRTIARAVRRAMDNFDGVVITHGTDTMCYTAAALSFMLSNVKVPVVLTGAQLPMIEDNSDAPSNLLDSVLVALKGSPGVQVVFNHKIIHGSRAFKMYSKNADAYVSRNYPYLGRVEGEEVIIEHVAKNQESDEELFTGLVSNVYLLKLTPATSSSVLDYIAEDAYSGVVIEGFGTGGISNLNRGMASGIHYLIKERNIPVVMISQCPYDGVNLAVYGIGEQANEAGVIPGNDMTTEAAVVKLMWALGKTKDVAEIRRLMTTNICDEISSQI